MGLNTSFTIYIKLYIQYHTYIGLTESMTDNKCISIYDIEKMNDNRKVKKGGGYVPSVNLLLFLMNVCTAFDSKIF